MIYRFTPSMCHANSTQLRDEVLGIASAAGTPVRWVCIDASVAYDVDLTAAEMLRSLHEGLDARRVRLVVAQVLDDVRADWGMSRSVAAHVSCALRAPRIS